MSIIYQKIFDEYLRVSIKGSKINSLRLDISKGLTYSNEKEEENTFRFSVCLK
jgi:hypothetical protein